jgi:hypothetical protein
MTTALLEAPFDLFRAARSAGAPRGRPATLEERLEGVWRSVQADGRASCPVCSGAMRMEGGAGRCGDCGSTLD